MYNSKKTRNKSTNKLQRVNSVILAQNRAPYFVFPKRDSPNINNNSSPMEEIRNNFFSNLSANYGEVPSSAASCEAENLKNNCLFIPPPPIPVLKRFSYSYNLGAYQNNLKKEQMGPTGGPPFIEKWVNQQRQSIEKKYPNKFLKNNNNNAPLIPQNGVQKLIPNAPRPIVKNWSKIRQNIPDELPNNTTAPSSSNKKTNNSKSIFKEIDEKWMRRNSTFKLTEIGHSIKTIKNKKPSSSSESKNKVQKEAEPSSTITSNALVPASANFTANSLYEDKIQQKIRADLLALDENNMALFKRYILKKSEEVNLILSGKIKKKEDPFDTINTACSNNNKQQKHNTHHYASTRHHNKKSQRNRKFQGIPAKNWVYQTPPHRRPYGSAPSESAFEPAIFFRNNHPEEAGNSYAGNNKPTAIPINLIHDGKIYSSKTPITDINFTITSQDLSPSNIIDSLISPDFLEVISRNQSDEGKLFNFKATDKNFFG